MERAFAANESNAFAACLCVCVCVSEPVSASLAGGSEANVGAVQKPDLLLILICFASQRGLTPSYGRYGVRVTVCLADAARPARPLPPGPGVPPSWSLALAYHHDLR